MPAPRKFTDQQHYLVRSLVLLNEAHSTPIFTEEQIAEMVGPLLDGTSLNRGTYKSVVSEARRVIRGKLSFEPYFKRISWSARSEA